MQIIKKIKELKKIIKQFKSKEKKIALVPTMGGLHLGHLSLVKKATSVADVIIVTIFVNNKQFGQDEDFNSYPRQINKDIKILEKYQVNILFCPDEKEIYPTKENLISIKSGYIGSILCGKTRPIFFDGVLLIVLKLFNICQANYVIFGKKDYQQFFIIKKLVEQFNIDITVLGSNTVREKNGLAMSTRNLYFNKNRFNIASNFYTILKKYKTIISKIKTESQIKNITNKIKKNLELYFKVDYLEILDANTLTKIILSKECKNYIIIGAVWLDGVRLIDNIIIKKYV